MSKPLTEAHLRAATRDIISHFTESQETQEKRICERFDAVDAKLEAIMEMLATRKELRNLFRELKTGGIELDENKIFAV